jgi:hypothetical protein
MIVIKQTIISKGDFVRKLFIFSILLIVGCSSPNSYKDTQDPSAVTLDQLSKHAVAVAEHYQLYSQVEGVLWQTRRSDDNLPTPDLYGPGADSALFGGFKVASDVFRYMVTGAIGDLHKVQQSLSGIYILTHITGTPGVIARCAFPVGQEDKWSYPSKWKSRIDEGFTSIGGALQDPFDDAHTITPMIYYTRGTKDQLTGLLLGVTVVWELLESVEDGHAALVTRCRAVAAQIVYDIYEHLKTYDFYIRDERGKNDTNADHVAGFMKLQLLAIYKETVGAIEPQKVKEIRDAFYELLPGVLPEIGDYFHIFNNYQQYFAWNLRYAGALTVFLTNEDVAVRKRLKAWCNSFLWPYIKDHQNTWFIYANNVIDPEKGRLNDALLALKSLYLRPIRGVNSAAAGNVSKPSLLQVLFSDLSPFVVPPHLRKMTDYFTWQKEPWDTGEGDVPNQLTNQDPVGLDYLLVYWMGRYYGFIYR